MSIKCLVSYIVYCLYPFLHMTFESKQHQMNSLFCKSMTHKQINVLASITIDYPLKDF